MQQVREIRRRIASIQDIRQITKAMYAISLARAFRVKGQLLAARRYQAEHERALGALWPRVDPRHPLIRPAGRGEAVFVINADRGLCGHFKGDLNRRAEQLLEDGAEHLIVGGDKARVHFERAGVPIARRYVHLYDRPTFAHAKRIASDLLDFYLTEPLAGVRVVYMRFLNDLTQRVAAERLLPLERPGPQSASQSQSGSESQPESPPSPSGADDEEGEGWLHLHLHLYLYEPSAQAAFEAAAPLYLAARVYRLLLESKASEHAVRRQAMKNATDNADELIQELTLSFNKARQQEITKQLADIVGGTEALKGGR